MSPLLLRLVWVLGLICIVGVVTRVAQPVAHAVSLASTANRQTWQPVAGACPPALEGAVFARSGEDCGGAGTTFDTAQIYSPVVLKDVASAAAGCLAVPLGGPCYRLWYVGDDNAGVPRIGYAVSPDGVNWQRVPGSQAGGSVLGAGAAGGFDSVGVSYFSVLKAGGLFHMWYSGYGDNFGNGLTDGIGYATSSDGLTWTRVPGPLAGGAVLRASGRPGAFDEHEAYVPYVLLDRASAAAPCAGVADGDPCFRMWYEGANTSSGYRFLLGYATSPDGLNWTRVIGPEPGEAVLGPGAPGTLDENSAGIAVVVKEGAFLRMWYEAKDYASVFRLGHVTSVDGLAWTRPTPSLPVFSGADDPATFVPDDVWSHTVLKDGPTYRMWYTVSTKPNAQRFGYAVLTPGEAVGADQLALSRTALTYTLTLTTTQPVPAGGSVLLTFPPALVSAGVVPLGLTGFGADASLAAEPAAVTDALAANVARGALVIRVPVGAPAGPKTVQFSLGATPSADAELLLQTFDALEVLEYGVVNLLTAIVTPPAATPTPTHTATPTTTATATATATSTFTATPSATATATETETETPTHTATSTASATMTATMTPSATLTATATATETPTHTATPTTTATATSTFTATPNATLAATTTATATATETETETPTLTATTTASATMTATATPSATAAATGTRTPTATPTQPHIPSTGNNHICYLPFIVR